MTLTVNGLRSDASPHHCSVPQGLVLKPVLFVIYSQPLFQLLKLAQLKNMPSLMKISYPLIYKLYRFGQVSLKQNFRHLESLNTV